jgi:hypothetical protein
MMHPRAWVLRLLRTLVTLEKPVKSFRTALLAATNEMPAASRRGAMEA